MCAEDIRKEPAYRKKHTWCMAYDLDAEDSLHNAAWAIEDRYSHHLKLLPVVLSQILN
ncbi:hypothetical protein HMPREF9244_00055 [Alloscardovia omnicolens F0580]|uniref:Uncharacterized protein n=1 Tax=Alloscardovia omnicolens F0580 TaxID=1321816 RepID=U1SN07_9BIFI|nr:hypothetical protein HMPREF9244_00055 [Alloscardovia omnicolens F0580]